jgi:hypothetical protein
MAKGRLVALKRQKDLQKSKWMGRSFFKHSSEQYCTSLQPGQGTLPASGHTVQMSELVGLHDSLQWYFSSTRIAAAK